MKTVLSGWMVRVNAIDLCFSTNVSYMALPAGGVVVLLGVAVWRCCQGEVNKAAQRTVSSVTVVQPRHEG